MSEVYLCPNKGVAILVGGLAEIFNASRRSGAVREPNSRDGDAWCWLSCNEIPIRIEKVGLGDHGEPSGICA